MTTKQEYQGFLRENFKNLEIKAGLFFNWNKGLRFDLQVGETNTNEYFEEVLRHSSSLFKSLFKPEDKVFLVLMDYRYKRNKIRFHNFCFNQIQMLQKNEVVYFKANKLYEKDDRDVRNIAVAKVLAERINSLNILKAIANTDFPPREPRLDKKSVLTSKEIFFINIDKKAIFHMYDDRGLDIIASNIETIRPIYKEYNSWILDSNREQIDRTFNKNEL